jgi:hypothetical protein
LPTLNGAGFAEGFAALWLRNRMLAWGFAFPAGIFPAAGEADRRAADGLGGGR